MKAVKEIKTQLDGFLMHLSIEQQCLKINLKSKIDGKRYEADHNMENQNDAFQFPFSDMQQVLQYIKKSLDQNKKLVKVSNDGNLQIGLVLHGKTKFLKLETEEIKLQDTQKLFQMIKLTKSDVETLKRTIETLKKQIREIKEQVSLKEIKSIHKKLEEDNDISHETQKDKLPKKFKENDQVKKSLKAFKSQISSALDTSQKHYQQKMILINKQIDDIKKKISNLNQSNEVQQVKQAQIFYVQQTMQKKFEGQFKKILSFQMLLNTQFSLIIGAKFIPLTVNSSGRNFLNKRFAMKNLGSFNQQFIKIENNVNANTASNSDQAFSNQQLPQSGKYYFQVLCHKSIKNSAVIGIITQNCIKNKYSYSNKQSIDYNLYNGKIYACQDQQSDFQGSQLINQRGLVTVIVDMDHKEILWCIDHQYRGKSKIGKIMLDKQLYAFVDIGTTGSVHQFRS